jgi:hypothetical protein
LSAAIRGDGSGDAAGALPPVALASAARAGPRGDDGTVAGSAPASSASAKSSFATGEMNIRAIP